MRVSTKNKFRAWCEQGNAVKDPDNGVWYTQDTMWKQPFNNQASVWAHWIKEGTGKNAMQYLFTEFLPYLETTETDRRKKITSWRTKLMVSPWMLDLIKTVCASEYGEEFPNRHQDFTMNGMHVQLRDGICYFTLTGFDYLGDFLANP